MLAKVDGIIAKISNMVTKLDKAAAEHTRRAYMHELSAQDAMSWQRAHEAEAMRARAIQGKISDLIS